LIENERISVIGAKPEIKDFFTSPWRLYYPTVKRLLSLEKDFS
jgi:hypothetical protein